MNNIDNDLLSKEVKYPMQNEIGSIVKGIGNVVNITNNIGGKVEQVIEHIIDPIIEDLQRKKEQRAIDRKKMEEEMDRRFARYIDTDYDIKEILGHLDNTYKEYGVNYVILERSKINKERTYDPLKKAGYKMEEPCIDDVEIVREDLIKKNTCCYVHRLDLNDLVKISIPINITGAKLI